MVIKIVLQEPVSLSSWPVAKVHRSFAVQTRTFVTLWLLAS
jgi:hypothetical protein